MVMCCHLLFINVILLKKNNTNFDIRGTGKPLRQFIYSEDLARGMLNCIERLHRENLIISPDEEYSIEEISFKIANAYDFNKNNIVFITKYSDGQFRKTADNSKFKKLLPDFKFTSLEEGIQKTVTFLKENLP